MLVFLLQPERFGVDLAAAAFATLAAPIADGTAALASTTAAAVHAQTAFAHLGAISNAMRWIDV